MQKPIHIIAWIAGMMFFITGSVALAAPSLIFQRTILPESSTRDEIGTSTKPWYRGFFSNLFVQGQGTGCAQFDANGQITSTGVACGTGGGGGGSGGAWATTTQNILTYLSSQWSAVVGANATTSDARFSVSGSSTISGAQIVNGESRAPFFTATSSATSTFPVAYMGTTTASNINGVVYVDNVRFARNSVGINLAITECARLYPNGCVVQLPMGTTTLSANTPIAPVSNLWIRGHGKGRTIIVPDSAATGGNGDVFRLITSSEPYYENIHISDLTINSTGQYSGSATATNAGTYSNGITLQGVDKLQINDVEVIRPFGFGILIGSSGGTSRYINNPQIWDVSITGARNGNDSIGGGGINGGFIKNYSFYDGYGSVSDLTNISNFTYDGVYATRTATGIYAQALAWGMGIDFGATNVNYNNINIDGAYFGLVIDQSASFGSSTDIKITNSTIKNLWKSAIYMPSVSGQYTTNVQILGNKIANWNMDGSSAQGVVFKDTKNCVIANNIFGTSTNPSYVFSFDTNISSTGVENCNIYGNDLNARGANYFQLNAVGTNVQIHDNPGYTTNNYTGFFGFGTSTAVTGLGANVRAIFQGAGQGNVYLGSWAGDSNYGAIGLGSSLTLGNYNFLSAPGQSLYINRPTNQSIYFMSNHTEQAQINGSGKWGIGSSTPGAKLTVGGDVRADYFVGTSTTASSTFQILDMLGSATSTWKAGINLEAGCFAVKGTCITTGGGSYTDAQARAAVAGLFAATTSSNTWLLSQTFNNLFATNASTTNATSTNIEITGQASSTNLTVSGSASVGRRFAVNTTTDLLTGNKYFGLQGSGQGTVLMGNWAGDSNYGMISLNGSASLNDYNFMSSGGDRNLYINSGGGKSIRFREGNTDTAAIQTGGNFGIGLTNPTTKLVVTGTVTVQNIVGTSTVDNSYLLGFLGIGTTSPYSKLSVAGQIVGQNFVATSTDATSTFAGDTNIGGNLAVAGLGTSSIAKALTVNSTGLIVAQNGFVGLGIYPDTLLRTYVPSGSAINKVEVGGGSASDRAFFRLARGGATAWDIAVNVPATGDNDLYFRSAGSNIRAVLQASGNLGIGTTSPGTLLSLGDTGANTINISNISTSTFGYGINLTSGCFAIKGTCLSGGTGAGASTTFIVDDNHTSGSNTFYGTTTLAIANDITYVTGFPFPMTNAGIRLAAMWNVAAGKTKIGLVKGTYQINSTLRIPNTQSIEGIPGSTVFSCNMVDGSGCVVWDGSPSSQILQKHFRGITITGNALAGTGVSISNMYQASEFSNNKLYNFTGSGQVALNVASTSWDFAISHNVFDNNYDHVVFTDETNNARVEGNLFNGATHRGLVFSKSSMVNVKNNDFTAGAYEAVLINDDKRYDVSPLYHHNDANVIENNYFENNGSSASLIALRVAFGYGNVIRNNYFTVRGGINIGAASSTQVKDNVLCNYNGVDSNPCQILIDAYATSTVLQDNHSSSGNGSPGIVYDNADIQNNSSSTIIEYNASGRKILDAQLTVVSSSTVGSLNTSSSTLGTFLGSNGTTSALSVAGQFTNTANASSTFTAGVKAVNGQFTALTNCDTIDTDANGVMHCGTDATGGGGGAGAVVNATGTPGQMAAFSGINSLISTSTINIAKIDATSSINTAQLTIASLSGVLKAASGLISGGATTSDLPEGTNSYWTSARATTSVSSLIAGTTTTALAEGTNLYYTPQRIRDLFQSWSLSVSTTSANTWTLSQTFNASTTVGSLNTSSSTLGTFLAGNGTTSALAIRTLVSCDTIDTDANGNLKCGTDATGGGGGAGFIVNSTSTANFQIPYYTGTNSEVGTDTIKVTAAEQVQIKSSNTNAFLNLIANAVYQGLQIMGSAVTDIAFSSFISGDSFTRFSFLADGTMKWGSGSLSSDIGFSRTDTGVLSLYQYGAARYARLAIGTSTTDHTLKVVGRMSAQPQFDCPVLVNTVTAMTADQLGSATLAPTLCNGNMGWDMLGTTDGTIPALSASLDNFIASGTPPLQSLNVAVTAPNNGNEGGYAKSQSYLGSATSSNGGGIAQELFIRTPNVGTATTSLEYFVGFADIPFTSLTTQSAVSMSREGCWLAASSTATWRAWCNRNNVPYGVNTGFATSTTAFKVLLELDQNGFKVYFNNDTSPRATVPAANIPTSYLRAEVGALTRSTCMNPSGTYGSTQCGISTAQGTGALQVGQLTGWLSDY